MNDMAAGETPADESNELHDRVGASVHQSNIPERIRLGMVAACQEMRDGWGRQNPEERDRLVGFIDHQTKAICEALSSTLTPMIDDFLSSGRGYFRGAEKGINIKDGVVTLTLTSERETVPEELYTHRGRFLIIIADDVASLEELNRQADLFGFGELPPIDEQAVDTAPPAAYTLDDWIAEFDRLVRLDVEPDDQPSLLPGAPLRGLLPSYQEYGWSPSLALDNELGEEKRPIADGPPIDGADRPWELP